MTYNNRHFKLCIDFFLYLKDGHKHCCHENLRERFIKFLHYLCGARENSNLVIQNSRVADFVMYLLFVRCGKIRSRIKIKKQKVSDIKLVFVEMLTFVDDTMSNT